MSNRNGNSDKAPVTTGLHPRVYAVLIGFALAFAFAVWGFAGPGETDYLLTIVSGFVCVVVALQLVMSRVSNQATADGGDDAQSLRGWLRATFATEQDRLSGAEAATLIILPIAAGAVGMMLFAIIFHIVEKAGT